MTTANLGMTISELCSIPRDGPSCPSQSVPKLRIVTDRVLNLSHRPIIQIMVVFAIRQRDFQSTSGPSLSHKAIKLPLDVFAPFLSAFPFQDVQMAILAPTDCGGNTSFHQFKILAASPEMATVAGPITGPFPVISALGAGAIQGDVERRAA